MGYEMERGRDSGQDRTGQDSGMGGRFSLVEQIVLKSSLGGGWNLAVLENGGLKEV